MKKLKSLHPQHWMALSALSTCFLIGSTASAYPLPAQDNRAAQDDRDRGGDRDQGIAGFNHFLDDHRDVGDRVRSDAWLLTNQDYLKDHPALRDYLQDHPEVRNQIQQNPDIFIKQVNAYNFRQEDKVADRHVGREIDNFNDFMAGHRDVSDQVRKDPWLLTNQNYLNDHPALRDYLRDHPQVQTEIQENPDIFIRQANAANTSGANTGSANTNAGRTDNDNRNRSDADRTRDADNRSNADRNRDADNRSDADRNRDADNRSDADRNRDADNRSNADRNRDADNRSDANRDRDANSRSDADRTRDADNRNDADRNRDNDRVASNGDRRSDLRDRDDRDDRDDRGGDRREVAQFDQFLDSHREIAEQVRKNPSLLQNAQFVKTHPALQTYLQQHPAVTGEIKENPDTFMHQEANYDRQTSKSGGDREAHYRQFGEFLGGHSDISKQLSKDPSLAKNQEYLANHPELRDYLTQHPDVSKDLAENPQAFITSSQHVSTPATSTTTTSKSTVKTPTTPNQ
jgi:hypothetical protein